ncbi:MAG TPA: carbamoyltransferase C-terminal domain-containing protein [Longimicrobiaceae bacterium]|nr:carbamoyltransferase C-terminal domain-containing protein [Longimicrobiaceae bacterium]
MPATIPSGAPRVLGLNRTSDASACLMSGAEVDFSTSKERLTRQKHHWGKPGDVGEVYRARLPLDVPLDLVVECYSADREIENFAEYQRELAEALTFRGAPRVVQVSHHLSHVYGSFHPSPFDEAAVLVVDNHGSPARDCTEPWPGSGRDRAPTDVECISHYACSEDAVVCIGKQVWARAAGRPGGLGAFYAALTKSIFPGSSGREGIVMGLAPFGDPEALALPALTVREGEVHVPEAWVRLFHDPREYRWFTDRSGSFDACAALAARGQRVFEDALVEVAGWLRERTGMRDLVYTGGCALNCAANTRLLAESGFERVFIPPAPHDGGTGLGCAVYGTWEVLGHRERFRWGDDYLGPLHPVEPLVQRLRDHSVFRVERPDDLVCAVAGLLASGEVVALYQGRSESGPRALGNRSLLADPRYSVMTTYINEHVKRRQWFRPLAPAVPEEMAGRYFAADRPLPFMQFAVDVLPEARASLAAVTHVDGTARVQTVSARSNPLLHSLLHRFGERTGTYVLLNTSFNGPEEPIVETPEEAFRCFAGMPINALAIPPYLVMRREPVPGPYTL